MGAYRLLERATENTHSEPTDNIDRAGWHTELAATEVEDGDDTRFT